MVERAYLQILLTVYASSAGLIYFADLENEVKVPVALVLFLVFVLFYTLTPAAVFFSEVYDKYSQDIEQPVLFFGVVIDLRKHRFGHFQLPYLKNYLLRGILVAALWTVIYKFSGKSLPPSKSLVVVILFPGFFFAGYKVFMWTPLLVFLTLIHLMFSKTLLQPVLAGLLLWFYLVLYRSSFVINKPSPFFGPIVKNYHLWLSFISAFYLMAYFFPNLKVKEHISHYKKKLAHEVVQRMSERSLKSEDARKDYDIRARNSNENSSTSLEQEENNSQISDKIASFRGGREQDGGSDLPGQRFQGSDLTAGPTQGEDFPRGERQSDKVSFAERGQTGEGHRGAGVQGRGGISRGGMQAARGDGLEGRTRSGHSLEKSSSEPTGSAEGNSMTNSMGSRSLEERPTSDQGFANSGDDFQDRKPWTTGTQGSSLDSHQVGESSSSAHKDSMGLSYGRNGNGNGNGNGNHSANNTDRRKNFPSANNKKESLDSKDRQTYKSSSQGVVARSSNDFSADVLPGQKQQGFQSSRELRHELAKQETAAESTIENNESVMGKVKIEEKIKKNEKVRFEEIEQAQAHANVEEKAKNFEFKLESFEKIFKILLLIFLIYFLYNLIWKKAAVVKEDPQAGKAVKKILKEQKKRLQQEYSSQRDEMIAVYHAYLSVLALEGIVKLDSQTPLQFEEESSKRQNPLKTIAEDVTYYFNSVYYGKNQLAEEDYKNLQKIKKRILSLSY